MRISPCRPFSVLSLTEEPLISSAALRARAPQLQYLLKRASTLEAMPADYMRLLRRLPWLPAIKGVAHLN